MKGQRREAGGERKYLKPASSAAGARSLGLSDRVF